MGVLFNRKVRLLLLLFIFISVDNSLVAQISVAANQTAAALVQKLAGKGVIINNPVLKCPGGASGTFTVVKSNLGLDSGIVLTTGAAASGIGVIGVNGPASYFASNNNGAAGDAQLSALSGEATHDACILEFDIIPHGDTVKFEYVFSSEEYKNAVCGNYNDVFAFFISGPGITGQENMALVPGTNIPVTINSVNNGIPGPGCSIVACNSMGTGSPFTSYYVDNALGTTVTHQGMTDVLTAIHSVIPCNTYHLKLAVADGGNSIYDSGVFLKAGSLQTATPNVQAIGLTMKGNPTNVPYCIKNCSPGIFRIKQKPARYVSQVIKYDIGGDAINGIDYALIPDSVVIPAFDTVAEVLIRGLPTPAKGTKIIKLFVKPPFVCSGDAGISDSAMLNLYDSLHVAVLTPDTTICKGDDFKIRVNGDDIFSYSWSPAIGLENTDLKEPYVKPLKNTTYTLTTFVPQSGCKPLTDSISVLVKFNVELKVGADTSVCYNDALPLRVAVTPDSLVYNYMWEGPDNYSAIINSPIVLHTKTTGAYTVSVRNNINDCVAHDTVLVGVITFPPPAVVSPMQVCLGTNIQLEPTKLHDLVWYSSADDSIGSTSFSVPSGLGAGIYHYYVSEIVDRCKSLKANVAVQIVNCCDDNIFIPDAFTPNGDGRNDKFRVAEGYGYTVEKLIIYNRWGQIVYSGYGNVAWDGNYNGYPAEVGTYYYNTKIKCIKGGIIERKGAITLIR